MLNEPAINCTASSTALGIIVVRLCGSSVSSGESYPSFTWENKSCLKHYIIQNAKQQQLELHECPPCTNVDHPFLSSFISLIDFTRWTTIRRRLLDSEKMSVKRPHASPCLSLGPVVTGYGNFQHTKVHADNCYAFLHVLTSPKNAAIVRQQSMFASRTTERACSWLISPAPWKALSLHSKLICTWKKEIHFDASGNCLVIARDKVKEISSGWFNTSGEEKLEEGSLSALASVCEKHLRL